MDRRGFLIGGVWILTTLGGCLDSQSSTDIQSTNNTETTNQTADTESIGTIEVTETGSGGPYTIGPSSPGCPVYKDGERVDSSWGMAETTERLVTEPVTGAEDAGRLLVTERDHIDEVRVSIPQGDRIEWTGSSYNITDESATGDWYILYPNTHGTYLAIPLGRGSTLLRKYTVGDC